MHRTMVWTIFLKDLRDAIRDGRVLLALLVPMGLGIFYNVLFDDETPRPSATVAYTSAGPSRLPELLREVIGGTLDLTLIEAPTTAAVKGLVDDETADLGLAIPAGFDASVAGGRSPPLSVMLPPAIGTNVAYVDSALDEALRRMANQPPPARVETQQGVVDTGDELIFDRIGPAPYFVLTSVLFLAVMVALFAVPIILPFLGPVYGVGLPTPRIVDLLLQALPTSQATRLVMNAALGERLFDRPWLSYLVIGAWGVAAYGLVLWRLSRRQG